MSDVDSQLDPTPEGAEDNETAIPAITEKPTTAEDPGNPAEENNMVEHETDTLFSSSTKFSMFGGGPKKEKKEEKRR